VQGSNNSTIGCDASDSTTARGVLCCGGGNRFGLARVPVELGLRLR
jgi:hypothetical protein